MGAIFLASACLPAAAVARQTVHGSDLSRIVHAPLVGAVPLDETMTVGIGLPWRDPQALSATLSDLYDPHSPNYRRFLDPATFIEEFGPTQEDYQKVLDFARARHLSVSATTANRLIVDVRADAATVQSAFNVTLHRYRRPDGSVFRAPDRDPSVDLDVNIAQISGLDDFDRPRTHLVHAPMRRRSSATPNEGTGTGSGGGYQGYDFRDAYLNGVPSSLQGSGQTIGLFELSGFFPSDISAYEQSATPQLPANTAVVVPVDGGGDTSDNEAVNEVSLDIEVAVSMAPAATIMVYEGPDPTVSNFDVDSDDILAAMATQTPLCRQISSSWFGFGDSSTASLFAELAAQGQGFFEASGDDGAFSSNNTNPETGQPNTVPLPDTISPYITLVGGTNLITPAPSGSPPAITYGSETTWNDYAADAGGGSSGGGICDPNGAGVGNTLALPSYQSSVSMAGNGGSTTWRDDPDVSMVAEDFEVVSEGQTYPSATNGSIDGTSGASPLWAAFLALANEQAASEGVPPVGFANPALYAIGGSSEASAFHDIADGSNNSLGGTYTTFFTAVPGYDLATGWGSPDGMAMINALVAATAVLGTSGGALLPGTSTVHFVTYPNPYVPGHGPLDLRYAPTTLAATLEIFDSAYRCLSTVSLSPFEAGLGEGTYCGCDGSGHPLAPGAYYAVIKAGDNPQICTFTVLP